MPPPSTQTLRQSLMFGHRFKTTCTSNSCFKSSSTKRYSTARYVARRWATSLRQNVQPKTMIEDQEESTAFVSAFNQALARNKRFQYNDKSRIDLWAAFKQVKRQNPAIIHQIPESAWQQLWASQVTCRPDDSQRLINLQALVKDMGIAGKLNEQYQAILQLELLHATGEKEQALQKWLCHPNESNQTSHSLMTARTWGKQIQEQKFSRDWLELGIRLYAASGMMSESHKILTHLGKRYGQTDPRLMVYVIVALTLTQKTTNVKNAWSLYLDLSNHEGFQMCAHDFSLIVGAFLDVGYLDYATMILAQGLQQGDFDDDSKASLFTDLLQRLFKQCTSPESTNLTGVALCEYAKTPQTTNLLFSSWLQKSKQFNDSAHIAYIIELMYESGITVKPWMLNQLIECWFNGTEDQANRAEELAISMIEKWSESTNAEEDRKWFRNPFRRDVPKANKQTFLALMKHYASQKSNRAVYKIRRILMSNSGNLLDESAARAVLSIHFIMEDYQGAWEFFQQISKEENIQITVSTYAVLWKGLHLYITQRHKHDQVDFPAPRLLFKFMLDGLSQESTISRSEIPSSLYERIVKCFCITNDTVGLFVVLNSMKDIFGIKPSLKTIENIVKHAAIREMISDYQMKKDEKPWIDHISSAIAVLEYCHMEVADKSGLQPDQTLDDVYRMDPESAGDHSLRTLSNYLKLIKTLMVQLTQSPDSTPVDDLIENVKANLGIDQLQSLNSHPPQTI